MSKERKVIILPGFSPHNKQWAQSAARDLERSFKVEIIEWKHWATGNVDDFSLEAEIDKVLGEISSSVDVNILAKSVGTLVAVHVIERARERVDKVILCGVPLLDFKGDVRDMEQYESALRGFPVENLLCFQNEFDPHGSFEDVRRLMNKINPLILVKNIERSDHDYPFYREFGEFFAK